MKLPRLPSGPRSSYVADFLLLFVLASALVWPLYKVKYLDNWGSIDSTFIADARMLKENAPHPGWQPYWYCGTRWDYIYPPALRYGTAILSTVLPVSEARGYHIYTALMYCLGIAGIYLLVRLGSGSRRAAWFASAAVALVSPIFFFALDVRVDAGIVGWGPQRLNALVHWGEGPHVSALSVLGIALAVSMIALRRPGRAMIAGAGVLCALVVSNNFYGATSLALFFPVLVWSVWLAHKDRTVWFRAAAIVVIAYGLTAFWLTPSYLGVTRENLKLVAQPGNTRSFVFGSIYVIALALVSWKWLRGRKHLDYTIFVAGSFAIVTLYVLGDRYFHFRVFGEPTRLMPEFDLFFILAAIEVIRRCWGRFPNQQGRIATALVIQACFLPGLPYLSQAWSIYRWDGGYKGRIEYRVAEWMHANMPDARAFTNGSVRFWYNVWFNGSQMGGGSEQGLLNGLLAIGQWELAAGDKLEPSVLWLQATGTDVAIVSDKNSQEFYHDFAENPKFNTLPVLWDSGHGDRIHKIPRRFPGIARVVETAKAMAVKPFPDGNLDGVRAYVDVVENGPDSPATAKIERMDTIRVHATVAPGQSIVLMQTYDPAFRATANGATLPIRQDAMGFMLIDAPPGTNDITLKFETPLQNQVGRVVTLLTLCLVLYLFVARPRSLAA